MPQFLWIAPNLNHYRISQLNHFALKYDVKLIVLAGKQIEGFGHQSLDNKNDNFHKVNLRSNKKNFHIHPKTYLVLLQLISKNKFNFILMPFEKKFTFLILFLFIVKFFLKFKLISYNHPISISKNIRLINLQKYFSKLMFKLYDRLIFYTKKSRDRVVEQNIVSKNKAYYANNTLNTAEIWKNHSFTINHSDNKTILFIGRLIHYKKLNILMNYYQYLKKSLPQLRLIVIGDGPESYRIKTALKKDSSILWRGGVVNEKFIAADMLQSHIVFVPGLSGLSIVHAFCYGKPYVTITDINHGPEIDYLHHDKNGIILSGQMDEDCTKIENLLSNKEKYESMCKAAFETAQKLSIDKWCRQIQQALIF